jgi:signal peptidase II
LKTRYLYLLAVLVVALDQACKFFVQISLPFGESVPVIRGVFYLTALYNTGGAFSLFQPWTGLLAIGSAVVIIALLFVTRLQKGMTGLLGTSLALLMGGAAGNLIDRVRLGRVIDFIDFRVWPVFNIADIAITAGIFFLCYHILFCETHASGETEDTTSVKG